MFIVQNRVQFQEVVGDVAEEVRELEHAQDAGAAAWRFVRQRDSTRRSRTRTRQLPYLPSGPPEHA